MDLDIFKSASGSINKLFETISNGIDVLYAPIHERRMADAKAYSIIKISEAEDQAEYNRALNHEKIEERIAQRITAQETSRQNNIDEVVALSANILETKNEKVSEEKVDDDWTRRFFNIVQDVSNEDMKKLWSQILAGEVARPKSFSLRTLEALKNMSKEEASLIVQLSKYLLHEEENNIYFLPKLKNLTKGMSYHDILTLDEIGVINSEPAHYIGFEVKEKESDRTMKLTCNRKSITVTINGDKMNIPSFSLTRIGNELINLTDKNQDVSDEYIQEVKDLLRSKNLNIIIN